MGAYIKLFGRDDIRMELIEVGGPKLALKLMPPANKPETFKAEAGDFLKLFCGLRKASRRHAQR